MAVTPVYRELADAGATEALGRELSLVARPGTAILLAGELGAGKSTLARAFIRALAPDDGDFDVPSPTFTLVQHYDQTRIPVAHADLYRIQAASEMSELGLDELLKTSVVLVEWPAKLDSILTPDGLTVGLSTQGKGRRARLEASGSWRHALARLEAIAGFLDQQGWQGVRRSFLEGDASFRRYERLSRDNRSFVLMDMPARPDGPPVKQGKPYSQIAHLAEDIRAVAAVNGYLRSLGYSAPETYACDLAKGLAIIEDFGSRVYGRMMLANDDMREPMQEAVRLLADMAERDWPQEAPAAPGVVHRIPLYDRDALAIETELLTEWFWPVLKGATPASEERESFGAVWSNLFDKIDSARRVWTLRDYHSPNLMWLPERRGLARVGLIDTQDCVLGHPAYDLASLLQDARVDVASGMADRLLDHYMDLRARRPGFNAADFKLAFAILGAQRATKILGIFARLSKRDGKHGYLRHMPRVSRYLERNLQHPDLIDLKRWYDRYLPSSLRESALA
jgi:tRNA threonylcarbamoyl adenosine modification protein YjeE